MDEAIELARMGKGAIPILGKNLLPQRYQFALNIPYTTELSGSFCC